ncbi:MAG TPA: SRPBCC domain-containing protein [Polyangia bacterium]|jgi:uncharacterized protein YndB with AHSA1/START domain
MSFASSSSVLIKATREAVWEALTSPALVKQYFFDTDLVTDWTVGSPILFRGEWDGKAYEDRGTVLAFEPMNGFSFNYWSGFSGLEDRPELRQLLRYAIDEVEGGIRVKVDQSNIDTEVRAAHSASNWREVLLGLKKFVEERAPG